MDTVTPLPGVKQFCDRMRDAGNACELRVFEGYGHMFTPAGVNDAGQPRPDPAVSKAAAAAADQFLRSLGYIR